MYNVWVCVWGRMTWVHVHSRITCRFVHNLVVFCVCVWAHMTRALCYMRTQRESIQFPAWYSMMVMQSAAAAPINARTNCAHGRTATTPANPRNLPRLMQLCRYGKGPDLVHRLKSCCWCCWMWQHHWPTFPAQTTAALLLSSVPTAALCHICKRYITERGVFLPAE